MAEMGEQVATASKPHRGRMPGPDNHNWKGGRSIASNGYMLVKVGTAHHLADIRGYAYEHRIVAEEKIGRRLQSGEQVHHVNGNKLDNRPENLEVLTAAEHRLEHREREDLRLPRERNPWIFCACGCLTKLDLYDKSGRPRRFVTGHNTRTRKA